MKMTYLDLLLSSQYNVQAFVMLVIWVLRTIIFPGMVSLLLVRLTIILSHQYGVVAHPSSRGSHTIPTPRLGGLGSAAAFFLSITLMNRWGAVAPFEPWRLVLMIGGLWALLGGALDDFEELSPRWKLLVQVAAAGSVLMFGFAPTRLDLPFGYTAELPAMVGAIIAMLVVFFMMNIFNFMDGMDGQASVFGVIIGLTLGIYLANYGLVFRMGLTWNNMYLAAAAAMTAGSLLGLLWHNYPGRDMRWKTFMGDCGSQFYGFILAVIALQAADGNGSAVFPWAASFILFSPFIYDVCFTLIRRYRRGERLTQAHRTHLYQRLMVAGWSHGRTLALNTGLYVIMAVLAYSYAVFQSIGFVQVTIILLAAAILAAYTWFVIYVEQHSIPVSGTP